MLRARKESIDLCGRPEIDRVVRAYARAGMGCIQRARESERERERERERRRCGVECRILGWDIGKVWKTVEFFFFFNVCILRDFDVTDKWSI